MPPLCSKSPGYWTLLQENVPMVFKPVCIYRKYVFQKSRVPSYLLTDYNTSPTFFSDCTPESIFSSRAEHQVDLQRKLQEDPLIALRKKELDTRKRLLDNPIKMKQIQAYVRFVFVDWSFHIGF